MSYQKLVAGRNVSAILITVDNFTQARARPQPTIGMYGGVTKVRAWPKFAISKNQ